MSVKLPPRSLQNGTDCLGSSAKQRCSVYDNPWCWLYSKSQLFWSRFPVGPSWLDREYELGKEVLVCVWGQPGFPR